MKKLSLFLILLFMGTMSICLPVRLNEMGEFRKEIKASKKPLKKLEKSEIVAEPLAIKYAVKFSSAIKNPGEKILVKKEEKVIKLKPIFKKLVEVKEGSIVFNNSTRRISYVELKKTKEESSYWLLSSIISLILMIISNIRFFCKGKSIAASSLFATLAALAAAFAALTAFTAVLAAVVAAFATLAAFAVAFANINGKNYKILSLIYYILMIGYFISLFQ